MIVVTVVDVAVSPRGLSSLNSSMSAKISPSNLKEQGKLTTNQIDNSIMYFCVYSYPDAVISANISSLELVAGAMAAAGSSARCAELRLVFHFALGIYKQFLWVKNRRARIVGYALTHKRLDHLTFVSSKTL